MLYRSSPHWNTENLSLRVFIEDNGIRNALVGGTHDGNHVEAVLHLPEGVVAEERLWIREPLIHTGWLLLVEDEVEALSSVEGEAGVAGDERHAKRHGVGDDDVVRRVFVVHRRVDA